MIVSFIKKVLIKIISLECFFARKWVRGAYKRLMWAEWSLPPNPENFDHNIDMYYQWSEKGDPCWLERGIYNLNALKVFGKPQNVVELCCGDGFNTKNFYAGSCSKVYACDFDKNIIKHAKKLHKADNITYRLADIRDGIDAVFPELSDESVECVLWDAAIEHFTEEEIRSIMANIKKMLVNGGILSGNTITANERGLQNQHHEYEFKDMEDLKRFLTPYFKNVIVMESIFESRHNLHFYASDGILPFTPEWSHWV